MSIRKAAELIGRHVEQDVSKEDVLSRCQRLAVVLFNEREDTSLTRDQVLQHCILRRKTGQHDDGDTFLLATLASAEDGNAEVAAECLMLAAEFIAQSEEDPELIDQVWSRLSKV